MLDCGDTQIPRARTVPITGTDDDSVGGDDAHWTGGGVLAMIQSDFTIHDDVTVTISNQLTILDNGRDVL